MENLIVMDHLRKLALRTLSDSRGHMAELESTVADALEEMGRAKQDKLTGTAGQVVGFNGAGQAVAQSADSLKGAKPKRALVVLYASGWRDNMQTVSVPGVSADEAAQLIQPVPSVASQAEYLAAGILCTGQAADRLTFTADTVPDEDLTVYVVIEEVSA